MKKMLLLLCPMLLSVVVYSQITLSGTNYTQNFDGAGSGLPTGFQVSTTATATALGTAAAYTTTATAWNSTTSGWKNYASGDGLTSSSTSAAQSASTDRVVGMRQSGTAGTGGDPGSALEMQLANTTGFTNFSMSFKLQSLDASSPRTTTWRVDYGFGTSPTSFTSVTTSPVTITTGTTTFTNTDVTINFGSALDNINQPVWIRIATLTATTGSGNRPTTGIDDLVLNFTGGTSCTPPATQTSGSNITNTTATSFDINWTDVPGTNSLVVVKQGSAIAGSPSNGTAYTASTTFGSGQTIAGNEFVVFNGTGTTVSVTGLSSGFTYHVAVFSFDNATNCYNVTNPSRANATTLCPEPTTQVSTINITPGITSASINWSGGNGNSSLVKINSVNSFTPPLDGTTYTGNTVYGGGEQTIYVGTGSSVSVSGLAQSSNYFVTVYTFNSCGGTPDYLSTGNISQPFTTGNVANYYSSITTQTCATLKSDLRTIITNGMTPKTYGDLWIQYLVSDIKPREVGPGTSPNVIWDIYSDNPTGIDPYNFTPGPVASGGQQDNGTAVTGEGQLYNREHSVPQSWFGASASPGSIGPESDYFHVFPTDKKVNADRSNFIYGEVSTPTITSLNGSKLGPNTVTGLTGTTSFEPINEFKGDLARAFFYFVTRYENNMAAWHTLSAEGNLAFDGTTWPSIELPYLKMMLRWNTNDVVSTKEINRNDAAFDFQGNRNPFIDHPEYVERVWSSSCGLLLPVDLTVFTGKYAADKSLLNWTIERADGFSHFEIERSVDGGNTFEKVGTVQWFSGQNGYSFADDVATLDGTILYRLKMVDQNRVFKYSNIIAVKLPDFNGQVAVYPNPATDIIRLSFRKPATGYLLVNIYDASGRNISSVTLSPGLSNYSINVSNLPGGNYMLRVSGAVASTYSKFIIQK